MKRRNTADNAPTPVSVERQIEDLHNAAEMSNIEITEKGYRRFEHYINLIATWNKKVRLTSLGDVNRIARRHLFESLLLTKAADLTGKPRLLDIGTGAGLPGIPLKIWNPDIELTLLDSDRRKTLFLELVSDLLELENIRVMHSRADNPQIAAEYTGYFDVITARAVAPLKKLLDWSQPLLKNGSRGKGYCLFSKGSRIHEEIKDIKSNEWQLTLLDLSNHLPSKKQNLIIVTSVLSNT